MGPEDDYEQVEEMLQETYDQLDVSLRELQEIEAFLTGTQEVNDGS